MPGVCNLIEKETPTQLFSREFYKAFKNSFVNRTTPVAVSTIKQLYVPIQK